MMFPLSTGLPRLFSLMETEYAGTFLPGIPVPTPIFITAFVILLFWLVLKFTTLGLYTQSVGINASYL